MYPRNSLHENPGLRGRSGFVRESFGDSFGGHSGAVRELLGGRSGVVQSRSGIVRGSVRGWFGGRSAVVRGSFDNVPKIFHLFSNYFLNLFSVFFSKNANY